MNDMKVLEQSRQFKTFLKNGVTVFQITRNMRVEAINGVTIVRIDSAILVMVAYVTTVVSSLLFIAALPELYTRMVAFAYASPLGMSGLLIVILSLSALLLAGVMASTTALLVAERKLGLFAFFIFVMLLIGIGLV